MNNSDKLLGLGILYKNMVETFDLRNPASLLKLYAYKRNV